MLDNIALTESSITQMSFQNEVCERWIGSLDADSHVTGAMDEPWMSLSSMVTAAMSGGGVRSKRGADGPLQEDGPSKRRKAVRDMSECLLNSISVRAAHAINLALAPGAEPLIGGQNNLVFPRFSQSSKSPHFDLPAESRSARRGEKRVLFPSTGGASLTRGLAGAVDLTEPLFEDVCQDSDCLQLNDCIHQMSVGVGVNTAATDNISKPVYDTNNNLVDPKQWGSFSCGIASCNPRSKYEDLLEFVNGANTHDFGGSESAIEQLGIDLLKKEPKPCPTSAFQLFSFKVLPLLRTREEEAFDAVRSSWDRLPTTEKYAFEMQKFALKDSYRKELMTFVDNLPESTRIIYLSWRRREHAKFFGFDTYKGYAGEDANGDACSMDESSCGQSQLLCTPRSYRNSFNPFNNIGSIISDQNSHAEQGSTNFHDSGHLGFKPIFEFSFSTARNSTQNFTDEPFNTSFEQHADKTNYGCTSLSDLATSFSSASWHTDEEPFAFEELSFIEEDVTQEFDSDSDCDSSQTSTVTSVVMRPARN